MKKTSITILLVVGILVFANLVSNQLFFRLDLTEDKQYTLSEATKNIMQSLESPITVKAYFSENLPPDIAKTKKDFEEYLIEYAQLSDNNLVYTFINPNENEEKERKAMEAGVNPVMINVREKDQIKQQKAFLGAVISLDDQTEVIPFLQPGAPLEYVLSSSIKKIASMDKPRVAFLKGFGEPDLSDMGQVKYGLDVLYQLEEFNLTTNQDISNDVKTLAWVQTKDTVDPQVFAMLDTYLENGGNLLIAMNSVEGDLSTAFGSNTNTGLEDWLKQKGLQIGDNFIVDPQCASVSVQQQQGMFRFNTNVSFPYLPIISQFADHPITKGLEGVVMQFASSLTFSGTDTNNTFTPIAFTSNQSGSQQAPLYFDVQKQWTQSNFHAGKQIVAGILNQKHPNGNTSNICVITDGDFAVSSNPRQQVQGDNVNFMVNAIDWLSDDTGLIDLRTKGIQFRPIDKLEDGTKTLLKYLNFLLPILLVMIYGLVRMQQNKNIRIKRMQENYE